jgi:divalent metal cation (Fe/Co/Zn/Cd) transporter
VVHFRHALRHESISEQHERLAFQIVTVGLLVVGAVTTIESAHRLVTGGEVHPTPAGIAIAAISVGVLALLARAKHRIAGRLPGRALRADGWLSTTGCLLAAVTVAGTGLTSWFGWWWADPVAALSVALSAVGIAVVLRRGEG